MATATTSYPALWSQGWYYDANENGSSAMTIPLVVRVPPPLHRRELEQAASDLIARHPSLRTTLSKTDAGVVQRIHPPYPVHLPTVPLPSPLHRGRDVVAEEMGTPFSVRGGPLLRLRLVPDVDDAHLLVIHVHHSVCDALSAELIFRDLVELYLARRERRLPELPPLSISMGDYAAWEHTALTLPVPVFWRERLATGHPRLRLGRAIADELPALIIVRSLPLLHPTVVARLERLALTARTTLARVLGAAVIAAASAYADNAITVRFVTANRHRGGLEDVVGNLAEWLPVRVDLDDDLTLAELVTRYGQAVADAYDHPFPSPALLRLIRRNPQRQAGPLFELEVNYLDAPIEIASRTPHAAELVVDNTPWLEMGRLVIDHWHDELAVMTVLHEKQSDGSVAGRLIANELAVSRVDAERLIRRIDAVLHALTEQPNLRLADLATLDA